MDNPAVPESAILAAILDSWDRHNAVLLNLLGAVPPGGLAVRAMESSPSIAEMLTHMHHERMISVEEEAPEAAGSLPTQEWASEEDPARLAAQLRESGARVREAVAGRLAAGRPLELNFGHPIRLIPFLIFHEAYHHGQIKLALKAAGTPIDDDVAGPLTWDVWRARA